MVGSIRIEVNPVRKDRPLTPPSLPAGGRNKDLILLLLQVFPPSPVEMMGLSNGVK